MTGRGTTKSRFPSPESMRLAADWLRCYDDEADEAVGMSLVADWLDQQADSAEFRSACKIAGVSVGIARAAAKTRN